jgi:phosphatidylglycerol---prolipoprotein diacylglyceryl transferase
MIRELFHIGSLSISPFGLMMVLAFLAAWAQLRWGMKRLQVGDEEDASALLLAAGMGGIAGAKIYYAILYGDWRLLFSRSGLVWYGALLLGAVAVLAVARVRRLSLWAVADAGAPAVAIGYAIGRIGCFLVGDDYGMPTELPWGVEVPFGLPGPTTAGFLRREFGADLPSSVPDAQLVPVHPTQLYETLAGLAICAFAIWWIRRSGGGGGRRSGRIGTAVLALLAVERFLVEFLRAKDDRLLGSFTLAQMWSVVAFVLLAFLWMRRRGTSAPAAAQRLASGGGSG